MKTQAWGWLTAAVLAAGLNASYHDGGMQWAHRIAERVEHNSNAVLALATGHANEFVTEARVLSPRAQRSSCPLAAAAATMANLQTTFSWSGDDFDQWQAFSDREQAQLDRLQANTARIQARVTRLRIPAVAMSPVVVRTPQVTICPRVRVTVPRIPQVKMPAMPVVHVQTLGNGPV
jgi:hypothetical protein